MVWSSTCLKALIPGFGLHRLCCLLLYTTAASVTYFLVKHLIAGT